MESTDGHGLNRSLGKMKRILTCLAAIQLALVVLLGVPYLARTSIYKTIKPVVDFLSLQEVRNASSEVQYVASAKSLAGEKRHEATATFEKDLKFLGSGKVREEKKVLDQFMKSYSTYCEEIHSVDGDLPPCPCVPTSLVGRQNLSEVLPPDPNITDIVRTHPEVSGGHWRPRDCRPLENIAIIIPYRNRTLHLHSFLYYMIPFLQRQLVEFSIFVVEQGKPEVFNKASIMNAGFLEASKHKSFDCYIFHDVDTFPEDDRNFYMCSNNARHLVRYTDRRKYRPSPRLYVGGGTAFTAEQFRRINGFSNRYYGWGGEDDDAYFRIVNSGMSVVRFPRAVAGYTILNHPHDPGNPRNPIRVSLLNKILKDKTKTSTVNDGLDSIKYNVTNMERNPLFTRIYVDLPQPSRKYRFPKKTPNLKS